MKLITLASRNVFRHRHRTAVTTLAMAFACATMIVFAALMDGFAIGSERNVVSMNTGDIQIHEFVVEKRIRGVPNDLDSA